MRLDEAKKILNKKGYVLEDTETQDEEYDNLTNDADDEINNIIHRHSTIDKDYAKLNKLDKKRFDLVRKHADLETKIYDAQLFNSIKDGLTLSKILDIIKKNYNVKTYYYNKDFAEISDYESNDICSISFKNNENIGMKSDTGYVYVWVIKNFDKKINYVAQNTKDILNYLKKELIAYKK